MVQTFTLINGWNEEGCHGNEGPLCHAVYMIDECVCVVCDDVTHTLKGQPQSSVCILVGVSEQPSIRSSLGVCSHVFIEGTADPRASLVTATQAHT